MIESRILSGQAGWLLSSYRLSGEQEVKQFGRPVFPSNIQGWSSGHADRMNLVVFRVSRSNRPENQRSGQPLAEVIRAVCAACGEVQPAHSNSLQSANHSRPLPDTEIVKE